MENTSSLSLLPRSNGRIERMINNAFAASWLTNVNHSLIELPSAPFEFSANAQSVDSTGDYFLDDEYGTSDEVINEDIKLNEAVCNKNKAVFSVNMRNLLKSLFNPNDNSSLPDDADDVIAVNGCRKRVFSENFQAVCSQERISIAAQGKILRLLQKSIQYSNFPVKLQNNKDNVSGISTAEQYCLKKKNDRSIIIDICCSNGCTVYFNENSAKLRCGVCNSRRFKYCLIKNCATDKYDLCPHPMSQKISFKSLRYRPLTPLLNELLGFQHFVEALGYSFVKPKADCAYWDISDGTTFKKHIAEMKKNYFSKYGSCKEIIMINILLQQNYDGCQVYVKKCSTFWPLTVSILNLPPSYRTKLGIGTFLMGVLTTKIPSAAENFFFEQLYVNELNVLSEGVLMRGKYFVQVRLISSCFDTKAVEDHCLIQSCGSKEGCGLCNCGRGTSVSGLKICNIGCRSLLVTEHYCRSIGQSSCCCPPGYYEERVNVEKAFEVSAVIPTVKRMRLTQDLNDFSVCDNRNRKKIYNFLNDATAEFVWYHKDIPYDFFDKYLYYHHADYRPQATHNRKTNDEYKQNGEECINKNLKHVKGVKGVWPEHKLPYTNIATDLCWDTFHIISTIGRNFIDNWKGERLKVKTIKFCKQTNSHPSLYINDYDSSKLSHQPWSIPTALQTKVYYYYYF
jgi:hypothetical protein